MLGIGLVVVVFLIFISSRDWKRSVKLVLFIVVIEGALRKWALPQASDLIFFLKDFILIGAYLGYLTKEKFKYPFKQNLLTASLILSIFWCAFQIFNPSLGSPIIGILGLKFYFLYVPLIWILPSVFPSTESLYKFLRNYLLLVIPVCILAILQFFSPASSPLNVYLSGQESTASVGGFVRVTGTFSYLTGFSTFLAVCFSLLFPMLNYVQARFWTLLTLTEFVFVVGTSFMTGARSLLLYEILFTLCYFFLLLYKKPTMFIKSVIRFVLPVTVGSVFILQFFRKAVEAFTDRVRSSSDSQTATAAINRALSAFSEPFEFVKFKGLDGFGTCASQNAGRALRSLLGLAEGELLPPSEGEIGRIILEIGPIGFIFWYVFRGCLIIFLFQTYLRTKNLFLRQLALSALLFHAINITGHLVFNHVFAVYYWFFSGFIYLLPTLEVKDIETQKLKQESINAANLL